MKTVAAAPSVAAAATAPVEPTTDSRTRDRVARLLLDLGPSTAAALGERLGLTSAAIRRHLDTLLADGTIEAREQRFRGPRGRGRPARVFALSDTAHRRLQNGYDDLATAALRYLAQTGGVQAVDAFARARVAELERRYRPGLVLLSLADRPGALAASLSGDGYAATTEQARYGVQLCQHHCPVQHVAAAFPQFCDAETEAFGRLLGTHVQRLATIAHGDGVCTTHVPLTAPPAQASPDPTTRPTPASSASSSGRDLA